MKLVNCILLEGFRTFLGFFATFHFSGIYRNVKHNILKTKQTNILKFSGNLPYLYRSK